MMKKKNATKVRPNPENAAVDNSESRLIHKGKVFLRVILNQIKVKEIMTSCPIAVFVTVPFHVIPEKFNEFRIRHLPVVNEHNKLIGLITQRDLFKIDSPRKLADGGWYYDREELDGYILENVMQKEIFTLQPEDTVAHALSVMARRKYGCIPIVDENRSLVGILTQIDLLRLAEKLISGN